MWLVVGVKGGVQWRGGGGIRMRVDDDYACKIARPHIKVRACSSSFLITYAMECRKGKSNRGPRKRQMIMPWQKRRMPSGRSWAALPRATTVNPWQSNRCNAELALPLRRSRAAAGQTLTRPHSGWRAVGQRPWLGFAPAPFPFISRVLVLLSWLGQNVWRHACGYADGRCVCVFEGVG